MSSSVQAFSVPRGDFRWRWKAAPNILVQGTESAIGTTLATLAAQLQAPVCTWEPGQLFASPAPDRGTVVLRHVECLDIDQQHCLMAWLETTGEYVRVVATTSERLFDYVERGVFLDALYYRLNAVLVDLHDGQLWCDDSYESFDGLL
jgi:hypothetical protein